MGSGYTVEGQKTSKEQHGGLQLEITPAFLPDLRLWSDSKYEYILRQGPGPRVNLSENKTPEQLGFKIGDVLRCYPADSECEEPFKAKHFARPGEVIECIVSSWNLELVKLPTDFECKAVNPQRTSQKTSELEEQKQIDNDIEMKDVPLSANDVHQEGEETTAEAEAEHSKIEPPIEPHELAPDMDREDLWNGEEDIAGEDGIENPDIQVIETKNIKAMGLAAGGKLSMPTTSLSLLHHSLTYRTVQDIYKDPHPATTWNHAAARILHIHILDPINCEKVTHVVPTPPSTDVKAYTEAGGKYFVVEEKVDERLDGGDFDNVKSVSQMDQHIGIGTEPEFDPMKPKMCTTCELRLCDCM